MSTKSATTFQSFITRALANRDMTTEELYTLARRRNLTLTRSRRRDTSRRSQFAWQHQLRRDQYTLSSQGVIARNSDGTWGLTGFAY
jgi:hypothetical protein